MHAPYEMHEDCHCNDNLHIPNADLMGSTGDLKHSLTIVKATDIATKLFSEAVHLRKT